MIKISKMADYAFVILTEMTGDPKRISSAAALSAATSLPEPTVSKILKILTTAGLVESVRGAGGGYRLGKTAEDVSVLDIITGVDGPVALVNCVENADDCRLGGTCCLAGRWDGVNAAVRGVLAEVTLANMMKSLPVCSQAACKGK